MEVAGKVALVTGAAWGTGRVIASRLAAEGARVVVADVDEEAARVVVDAIRSAGGEARAVAVDMTRLPDVEAMIASAETAFGGLDVLVNNAGGGEREPFAEASAEELDRTLDLNLRAPLHAVRLALPAMRRRGGGAIVNIASSGGTGGGPDNYPAYNAAKAGLIRLSETLGPLGRSHGVRVSAVVPGLILIERVRASLQALTPGERAAAEEGAVRPEDVAEAVLDLARDDTSAGRVVRLGR